jgi:hypothetical protein
MAASRSGGVAVSGNDSGSQGAANLARHIQHIRGGSGCDGGSGGHACGDGCNTPNLRVEFFLSPALTKFGRYLSSFFFFSLSLAHFQSSSEI